MTSIDIFYQGEGIREIEHIEVGPDHTFGALKALLAERHGLQGELLIFLEDSDEPLDETVIVREHVSPTGLKAHLHRCRHIEVDVRFNNEMAHHRFGPAATIARVKRWAAEREFGMSPEEASEHVLQIAGTQERPSPGAHIGALTSCPNCRLVFDLVPDHRVNGACGEVK
jgi:hypothetical protein